MTFLATLADQVRAANPDWGVVLDEGGCRLVLSAPEGPGEFVLGEKDGAVFLEGLWRLPLSPDTEEGVGELLLEVVRDGFEHHGWEVPVLLDGGPLSGRRVSQRWEDLVGRLVFAVAGPPPEAHFYKWHLRRTEEGDYVCRYERTLRGEEIDDFLRRGVESTGPFVIANV
jgi:hypothetical protein